MVAVGTIGDLLVSVKERLKVGASSKERGCGHQCLPTSVWHGGECDSKPVSMGTQGWVQGFCYCESVGYSYAVMC